MQEIKKSSLKTMKIKNRKLVLRLILETDPISRAEIARKTKLAKSAVSEIVNSLIREGFVSESGEKSELGGPGRKPRILKICTSRHFIMGYDIGTVNSRAVLLNLKGEILKKASFHTAKNFSEIVEQINTTLNELINRVGISKDKIRGLGLAVPGLVNSTSGMIEVSPNVSARNFPIAEKLRHSFNYPVSIDNNVKLMTIAEKRFGHGQNCSEMIFINLGPGIGAGIISNDNLIRGRSNFSGEFGHINVMDNGKLCSCGNYGCLETVSSAISIVRNYNDLSSNKIANPYDAKEVANRATHGDRFAKKVMKDAGRYLGIGFSTLVNLLNPELVVIGGGLSKSWSLMEKSAIENFEKRVFKVSRNDVEIKISNLGEEICAIGAAYMAYERFLGMKFR